MDPVSQAAVGSAVSGLSLIRDKQTKRRVKTFSSCLLAGAFAGMAPDLDVLIRSNHDPLLALELHRHFSHSLLFIPFGALICAAAFYPLFLKRTGISFATAYLWCLLGYGSHGLLDGHTTYGTHLLWPLSDARVAWNNISVVDPLFTVPLVLSLIVAAVYAVPDHIGSRAGVGMLVFGVGLFSARKSRANWLRDCRRERAQRN